MASGDSDDPEDADAAAPVRPPCGFGVAATAAMAHLRSAELLNKNASRRGALAQLAAMACFDLCAASHGAPAPSDVPMWALAQLQDPPGGWLYYFEEDLNTQTLKKRADVGARAGGATVFVHASRNLAIAVKEEANGFFYALSRNIGGIAVYSNPRGNNFANKANKQWADNVFLQVDAADAANNLIALSPDVQLDDNRNARVEWLEPHDKRVARRPPLAGAASPPSMVVTMKKDIGGTNPLFLYLEGAQRVLEGTDADAGFWWTTEMEAEAVAAADATAAKGKDEKDASEGKSRRVDPFASVTVPP